MNYIKKISSPLGELTLRSDGVSITGLWFFGQKYYPENLEGYKLSNLEVFSQTEDWLNLYFSGQEIENKPVFKFEGSDFQKLVWEMLLEIPFGETKTYGQIAKEMQALGFKSSAQAVGSAVGKNQLAILIPCHRVLGSDKTLTGYAGGLDRKSKLLDIEKIRYKGCKNE